MRKVLRAVRRDPRIARSFAAWPERKIADRQQAAIARFLKSHECRGLFELLAFIEHDREGRWAKESQLLADSFALELADAVTLPDHVLAELARELWELAVGCVRFEVASVREQHGETTGSYLRAAVASQILTSSQGAIPARTVLSANQERVATARGLVTQIRAASVDAYHDLEMPHSPRNHRVALDAIYVHRQMRLQSESARPGLAARTNPFDYELHRLERRAVILGNPGAGKSTYLRYLLRHISEHDDGYARLAPLYVDLKHYDSQGDIYLETIRKQVTRLLQREVSVQAVRDALALGLATVVFDGLDEVESLLERRSAVTDIEAFSRRYPLVQVIVTSRVVGYSSAPLNDDLFTSYGLPDFDNAQVRQYARRWFTSVGKAEVDPSEATERFMSDSARLNDLRSNPLMLSWLCLLYTYSGRLPTTRLRVYEECAELLFARWDKVRQVDVGAPGTEDELWYLFQELAHWFLFEKGPGPAREHELRRIIERHVAVSETDSLVSSRAKRFLDFCAGRAWLLSKIGVDDSGERLFDFVHRTFMEYFAACHISRVAGSDDDVVERVWATIQENGSSIVAHMTLQQYEIRSARGQERVLRALLADPAKNSDALHRFALETLDFAKPSNAVLDLVITTSVCHAAAHRSRDLIRTIARISPEVGRRAEGAIQAMLHADDEDEETRDRLQLGGALWEMIWNWAPTNRVIEVSLFVTNRGWSLSRPSAANALLSRFPHTARVLLRRGWITVSHYLDSRGSSAMLAPVPEHPPRPDAPVLLVDALQAGGDDLRAVLERITDEPDAIMSMSDELVKRLASAMPAALPAARSMGQKAEAGYDALALVLICALHQFGWHRLSATRWLTLEVAAVVGALRWNAQGRTEIGITLIRAAELAGLAPAWRYAFQNWIIGSPPLRFTTG